MRKHTNIALLVGIGEYDRNLTGLPALKYPVPDITAIGGILKRQGYEVALLTDRAATASTIRASIKELAKALDPGEGTFLFYFSGHGFRSGSENYLATFGTTASDVANQGLALTEVQKLLLATGAQRRMAFIDACRNDPESTRSVGSPPRSFQRLQESEGLRILYSTAPGEVSYEDDEIEHGVFSYFVIEGLNGKAASGNDGFITFDDLRDYVTREMKSYGIARRRVQKPYQLGESTGDFLLAKQLNSGNVVQPLSSPVPLPTAPPPAASGGIGRISNDSTTKNVSFLWQSDAFQGRFFKIKLDRDAVYIYLVNGDQDQLIGTLIQKIKNGATEMYEGEVPLALQCPGGRGLMQIKSWNENRLEAKIEQPYRDSATGAATCGGGRLFGFKVAKFTNWQTVYFVKR